MGEVEQVEDEGGKMPNNDLAKGAEEEAVAKIRMLGEKGWAGSDFGFRIEDKLESGIC